MNVVVVAHDRETGAQLARAAAEAGFEASLAGAEVVLPASLDVLVLDGFAGAELTRLATLVLPAEERPIVLAGVPLERDTLDLGIEAGIDGFYPAGLPRELVFQLVSWERRSAAARASASAGQRIEQANDVIYTVDFEGNFTSANAAAERLTGYAREQIIGMNMGQLLLPEYIAVCQREIAAKLAGDTSSSFFEVRIRRADGAERAVEISSQLLFERGRPVAVQGIARDLSERRELEARLRFLATVFESAAVGVLARDLSGRVISWNPMAERMFGYSADEAVGSFLTAFVPERERDASRAQFAEIRAGGVIDVETIRLRKNGAEVPVRMTAFPLRDGDGAVTGTAALFYDLSEKLAGQRALADSEARYRAAAELSMDGLFILDAVRDGAGAIEDFVVLDLNTAGESFFFAPRGEIVGRRLTAVVPPDGAGFLQPLREVVETGRPLEGEFYVDAPEVNVRWVHVSVVRLGDGVAVTCRDITERHQREAELAETRAELRAIFESTSEALLLIDPDLRVLTVNRAGILMSREIFGHAPQRGDHVRGWAHEADWPHFERNCRRALAGERLSIEWPMPTVGGGRLWVEYTFNPVRDEQGTVTAVAMLARDVTDRKAAEQALEDAVAHHRTVVENTSDALFVLEVEGDPAAPEFRVGMVNGAFARLTGLDAAAISGRLVSDVLPPPAWAAARERYLQAIAAGETISYEEEVPYGTRPHIQTRMTPIFDAAGRCTRIVGSSRDITEQVRLETGEREARERAERLALIVQSANDAIIGLDMERRIVSWSPGAERVYGYTPEEAIGQRVDLIYPGDEAERAGALERLGRVYEGAQFHDALVARRHKSGRLLTMLISAFPLRDADGNIVGVGSTATDVTAQREAEEAFRNKAADLDAVFASTRHQLFLLDERGWIVSANKAAIDGMRQFLGKDISAGGDMREFVPDLQVFERNLARCLAGETLEFERSSVVDGQPLAMEVEFTPVHRDDGTVRGVIVAIRDITERKRTTEALMQAQKLESLAVLAGGIAHDFNNLLVGILGNAGLALSELPATSPARPTVESIELAGQRAAELARQMLAYSGKGKFVIQDVDVSSLVEEMTHLLRVSISKQVSLQLQLAHDLPAVQGDATQLRQVIMNLVVNASDAIGEDEGVISIRSTLLAASREMLAATHLSPDLPAGDYVCVEVTDSGRGMDQETLARVFDPFFTTKFTGRGLGLAAVLGIVRGHRGAIKVESTPGEGTTFKLFLPAAGSRPVAGSEMVHGAQWSGSGTVLVVDDEPTVRTVTARALKAFGFDVIEAADGVEGVEAFRANRDRIVCVLLDMTMPRMNGEEAYRAITGIDPSAKVVLMSGYTEQDATGRFEGRRLAGFIQKPYELATLRAVIRAAIEDESAG